MGRATWRLVLGIAAFALGFSVFAASDGLKLKIRLI
jgi:hypothetical protein